MSLKTLLHEKGIKQKWLADQLNVSEMTVSSWCNGKSTPRQKRADQIVLLLNISKDELNRAL